MRKVILMILDGWGLGTKPEVSAIAKANTPFMDSAFEKYPHSKLDASGMAVGLPEGQMGNSEVGHMNIGAGRVVYQDLVKINRAIEEGEIKENDVLNEAYDYAKKNNKKVHLIGLVSDGGVHSHINHLKGLISYADEYGLEDVFVHAFTDGRDTDPKSGAGFLKDLQNHLSDTSGELASIIGRYYAMDRDKRWERVKLAYDAMVKGEGKITKDPLAALKESYEDGVTDEFVKPIIASENGSNPKAVIEDGDVVICFNFRTDRGREITMALTQQDFPEQNMHKLDLHYVTMTRYDDTFEGVRVVFEKDNLKNTLGETLADQGKKQIRIAETEKYPHVTFFFSGGREKEFDGEKRILIPSPKVATYDMQPEMSAREITDAIVKEIKNEETDFICLNFANPDMVGHTGDFDAAVKACETVDQCAKEVAEAGLEHGYDSIIIADHGNSDFMINDDGSPNTAHTTNLVPSIHVSKSPLKMKDGKLGDLAPTILTLMDLNIPEEMTGNVLLKEPVSQ
ncbi:2,3-bisphosphoglycerate-independent phosphoglycerate mutase [Mangrovivirga sp. M17]|uniref:2,3-bisphosphoglycerate-independent phosphoglycerate mutase n=1 Tax=Mangrovivirga halotolerans TaxID=2993936 RepID=A0ABT3RS17_9BACT|nr:2,3-bisphosphoglycerate-independent phosphoglycerate mutase [Mangrovivirga halotolerans]MCX2744587.1 2,3-bisphosphoglycerate-independent phosphoglycerate mutase [Mangrovivirga halotolerans]